jgi:hypothetical protein
MKHRAILFLAFIVFCNMLDDLQASSSTSSSVTLSISSGGLRKDSRFKKQKVTDSWTHRFPYTEDKSHHADENSKRIIWKDQHHEIMKSVLVTTQGSNIDQVLYGNHNLACNGLVDHVDYSLTFYQQKEPEPEVSLLSRLCCCRDVHNQVLPVDARYSR